MMEQAVFVQDFVECGSDDAVTENQNQISRGKARNWTKIKVFEEASEAVSYVENEGIWSKTSTKQSIDGDRVEFRCKKGKYRENACPAAIYFLYHSLNMKVTLYSTKSEHIHHNIKPTHGLDNESKEFVTNLFKNGVDKPNAIIAAFRDKNLLEPSKSQLNNFLRTLRRQMYGPCTISSNELNEWCSKRSIIPEDMDSLFVLDYKIECDSSNIENQDLKIVMSTKRLLGNLEKSNMIQVDATYKIIWQGYPLILAGTSDKNKVFHPLAISVCQNENDFSFIFSALQKYSTTWKPTVLLADGSAAITNGYSKIFENQM